MPTKARKVFARAERFGGVDRTSHSCMEAWGPRRTGWLCQVGLEATDLTIVAAAMRLKDDRRCLNLFREVPSRWFCC